VDIGDDARYPIIGMGSISLQIPLGDILELGDVLYVHG